MIPIVNYENYNPYYQNIDMTKMFIAKINNKKANIMVSDCPCKNFEYPNQDLDKNLDIIMDNQINVIICLLEHKEMKELKMTNYHYLVQKKGMKLYHIPIKDENIINIDDMNIIIKNILYQLSEGNNVLIHCRAGLGRSGMVCACCLTHFGYNDKKSIELITKRRPGSIKSIKQRNFINKYYKNVKKSIHKEYTMNSRSLF